MKKILFLLLISKASYGQADFPEGIQISGGQPTVTSTNFLTAVDGTGLLTKIAPVDLPFLNESFVSNGYVAQNPPALLTSVLYESFPLMVRGQSNKMFLFYRQGTDHATSKGVIQMRTSTDGGGNWTSATTLVSDPTYDCRNVSGGVTTTGRIILFYMRYAYGSSLSFDQGYIYSDNEGDTWSTYTTIPHGTHTFYSPYGNLISIGDGKIMANWYGETPGTPTYSSYVITSTDNGDTWSSAVAVATSTSIRYGEASYAYLDGGIIIGQMRNSVGSTLYQFKSIDNGATWTSQGQTTVDTGAQVSPDLITYVDSNNNKYIASFYANRADNKLKVAIADYSTAIAGVSGWTRSDIDTHSTTDFGYPSVVKSRENNKMLLAYYKAASTSLASIYFKNYTPDYGNISVTGTVSASGNISSNTNISAVATVSGKDLTSTNFLTIKGANTSFPLAGTGFELYNSSTSMSILQSYDRTGAVYNQLNYRGSFQTWNIGSAERMRLHASGGLSIGNTTDPGAANLLVAGNVTATTYNGVKRFKAINVSQTGGSAPTMTILENTIGNIVWTRSSSGTYVGTLTGAFTANKTHCIYSNGAANMISGVNSASVNIVSLYSATTGGTLTDGFLTLGSLTIEVYP